MVVPEQFVGWVERSETHRQLRGPGGTMGFAALYPSYGCGTWFVSFEAPGYPPPSSNSTKTPNTTTSITVSQPRLPRSPATTVGTRGGYSDRPISPGGSAVGSAPRERKSTRMTS